MVTIIWLLYEMQLMIVGSVAPESGFINVQLNLKSRMLLSSCHGRAAVENQGR